LPALDFVVGDRRPLLRRSSLLLNRFPVLSPDYFGEVLIIYLPVPIIEDPFSFVFKFSSSLTFALFAQCITSYRKCAGFWTCVWRIL